MISKKISIYQTRVQVFDRGFQTPRNSVQLETIKAAATEHLKSTAYKTKHLWFSSVFLLGSKTHARDEFSFLLAIKFMNY